MDRPVTTVALAFERLGLSEEVLHHLERDPALRVVGAVCDEMALARLLRQAHPAAVIGDPGVIARTRGNGEVRLAVAEQESVSVLRDALHAGARGFYLWPEDRDRLARDAGSIGPAGESERLPRGRVVAVYGPRGGAGTTFVATHLAGAAARLDRSACLVECDPFFSDLSAALGVPADAEVRTLADLLPVLDEVHWDHVREVLFTHPSGFTALLGPQEPDVAEELTERQLGATVDVVAAHHEAVILHTGRSVGALARAALEASDVILLVLSLDVLALRDARRALSFLEGLGVADRCRVVANRVVRSELIPADIERVLGLPVAATLRTDPAVPQAQDRGELVLGRSARTSRALVRLARSLLEVPE